MPGSIIILLNQGWVGQADRNVQRPNVPSCKYLSSTLLQIFVKYTPANIYTLLQNWQILDLLNIFLLQIFSKATKFTGMCIAPKLANIGFAEKGFYSTINPT